MSGVVTVRDVITVNWYYGNFYFYVEALIFSKVHPIAVLEFL